MPVAGIDLGKVRVGLAVSDDLDALAHPRPFLDGRDPRRLLDALSRLVDAEQISCFVVGLPRSLDGHEGPPARRARRFAEELSARTGVPVELVDERWSTREATARLREQGLTAKKSRDRVDSAAAAVLLQSWLDGRAARAGRSE